MFEYSNTIDKERQSEIEMTRKASKIIKGSLLDAVKLASQTVKDVNAPLDARVMASKVVVDYFMWLNE